MTAGARIDVPPATRAAAYRCLERLLEEEYPGTRWRIWYDPDKAKRASNEEAADAAS